MRSSILSLALLAGLAFGSPINKRALVTQIDTVTDWVTVTWDGTGLAPTATPTSSVDEVKTAHVLVVVFDIPETTTSTTSTTSSTSTSTTSTSTSTTPPPPPPPPTTSVAPPAAATTTPAPAVVTPIPTPQVVAAATAAPSVPAAAPSSSPTAAAAPQGNGEGDGSPMSGSRSVLYSLNQYRSAYGLPPFGWDDEMASMIIGTEQAGGSNLVHSNLASWASGAAQILTWGDETFPSGVSEGDLTPFEVALGSWYCEVSSDPELVATGICNTIQGLYEYTETGHHDALVDPSYLFIGCGYYEVDPSSTMYQGQWGCNLATQHS